MQNNNDCFVPFYFIFSLNMLWFCNITETIMYFYIVSLGTLFWTISIFVIVINKLIWYWNHYPWLGSVIYFADMKCKMILIYGFSTYYCYYKQIYKHHIVQNSVHRPYVSFDYVYVSNWYTCIYSLETLLWTVCFIIIYLFIIRVP